MNDRRQICKEHMERLINIEIMWGNKIAASKVVCAGLT